MAVSRRQRTFVRRPSLHVWASTGKVRCVQMRFEFLQQSLHDIGTANATDGKLMTMIGYARTSTIEQVAELEAQILDLQEAGCKQRDIYHEQVSSVGARIELELTMSRVLRRGDVLVVTKLDRLARSVADLVKITQHLKAAGADLKVLDSPIDTGSPSGELILNVLGAVAQFEREIMLARQREGIAKAKAAGRFKGRVPTVRRQAPEILRLNAEGVSNAQIARRLGVHRASVGRVLKAHRASD